MRIDALRWFLWVAFVVITFIVRQIVHVAIFLFVTPIFSGRMSIIIVGGLAAAMAPRDQTRDPADQEQSIAVTLLRGQANEVAADDWVALEDAPNDTVVSAVGWVRGRQHLGKPIGGEPAVGVGLPCQHQFPGVFESLHDFEARRRGRVSAILILASEGRMFGTPNVALDSHELRHPLRGSRRPLRCDQLRLADPQPAQRRSP